MLTKRKTGLTLAIHAAMLAAVVGAGLAVTPDHAEATPKPKVVVKYVKVRESDKHRLDHILPYHNKKAPRWCEEDMPCWIGSKADRRSDKTILRQLRCDLVSSSFAYVESPNDKWAKDADFDKPCAGSGY